MIQTSHYFNLLGVNVSAINIPVALQTIDDWIAYHEQHYVCVTGVHGLIESQHDEALRQIHNRAGMVTPDGMPLVWLGKARGHKGIARVYGPDLMLALCNSDKPYRHFLFGSTPEVLDNLSANLCRHNPNLQIVGQHSPPFRALTQEEDLSLIQAINQCTPDIVWVGLSTPKQEHWMAEHVGKLNAAVLIGVGAAFDFHAGMKTQAPRWMQRNGFEWLFRLITEPKRLWRRYLINNPQFIALILAQALGLKRWPKES